MRYIIFTAVFVLSFFLIAQEPSLVPIAPESNEEEEKEEEKEEKSDYQDVYQQYLQKYSQTATPEESPAEEAEETPAEEPEAVEEVAVEKVEEAPEEEKPEVAEKVKKEKPKKERKPRVSREVVPLDPFVTNPYFSVTAYGSFNNGLYFFGKKSLSSSWRFALDNAILDFKGGNRMFNGRLLVDFAKGLRTDKVVAINYDHDNSMPTDGRNPVEYNVTPESPNALDILEDVSFTMKHPSYRKNGFGIDVNLQAGKFNMPFGMETLYKHEYIFDNYSYLNSHFLGKGFNDLGLSLGTDLLFSNEMNLAFTAFVFNGTNRVMLDGDNYFQDPSLGFDLRYGLKGDFYTTFAISFVFGSSYHDYDSGARDGIFQTTNNTYLDDQNKTEEYLILKEDGRNDYAFNKKNRILSIATDMGYKFNENVVLGLEAQFALSNRDMFNPTRIDEDGNTHIDANGILNSIGDGDNLRFIRDGSNNFWGSSSYTTWGFYAAPYARIHMFDFLARIGYNKAPFLYRYLEDSNNSTLALDFNVIYNFSKYANVSLAYRFIKETIHKYDREYNENTPGMEEWDYLRDIFYHSHIMLNLAVKYDFLWEKN